MLTIIVIQLLNFSGMGIGIDLSCRDNGNESEMHHLGAAVTANNKSTIRVLASAFCSVRVANATRANARVFAIITCIFSIETDRTKTVLD